MNLCDGDSCYLGMLFSFSLLQLFFNSIQYDHMAEWEIGLLFGHSNYSKSKFTFSSDMVNVNSFCAVIETCIQQN